MKKSHNNKLGESKFKVGESVLVPSWCGCFNRYPGTEVPDPQMVQIKKVEYSDDLECYVYSCFGESSDSRIYEENIIGTVEDFKAQQEITDVCLALLTNAKVNHLKKLQYTAKNKWSSDHYKIAREELISETKEVLNLLEMVDSERTATLLKKLHKSEKGKALLAFGNKDVEDKLLEMEDKGL